MYAVLVIQDDQRIGICSKLSSPPQAAPSLEWTNGRQGKLVSKQPISQPFTGVDSANVL